MRYINVPNHQKTCSGFIHTKAKYAAKVTVNSGRSVYKLLQVHNHTLLSQMLALVSNWRKTGRQRLNEIQQANRIRSITILILPND